MKIGSVSIRFSVRDCILIGMLGSGKPPKFKYPTRILKLWIDLFSSNQFSEPSVKHGPLGLNAIRLWFSQAYRKTETQARIQAWLIFWKLVTGYK
jgi:hypothetical protein